MALGSHLGELTERLAREEARVAELAALLPELEAAETELGERARRMAEAREASRRTGRVRCPRTAPSWRCAWPAWRSADATSGPAGPRWRSG